MVGIGLSIFSSVAVIGWGVSIIRASLLWERFFLTLLVGSMVSYVLVSALDNDFIGEWITFSVLAIAGSLRIFYINKVIRR